MTNAEAVSRILAGDLFTEAELRNHVAEQADKIADYMERTAHPEDKCKKGKNCVHGNPNVVRATRQLAMVHRAAANSA